MASIYSNIQLTIAKSSKRIDVTEDQATDVLQHLRYFLADYEFTDITLVAGVDRKRFVCFGKIPFALKAHQFSSPDYQLTVWCWPPQVHSSKVCLRLHCVNASKT